YLEGLAADRDLVAGGERTRGLDEHPVDARAVDGAEVGDDESPAAVFDPRVPARALGEREHDGADLRPADRDLVAVSAEDPARERNIACVQGQPRVLLDLGFAFELEVFLPAHVPHRGAAGLARSRRRRPWLVADAEVHGAGLGAAVVVVAAASSRGMA